MLDAQVTAFAEAVTVARACRAFAVNERSYRHRRQRDQGRLAPRWRPEPRPRRAHPAALSVEENEVIVATLCEERFVDLAPAQVYMALLDQGIYLCSQRHMYRVLAERGLVRERRRGGHQRAGSFGVPRLEADGPNKVWTWDITALRGPTKGACQVVCVSGRVGLVTGRG